MIVHSKRLRLDRVLDLTDERNLQSLATPAQDLTRRYEAELSSKSSPYEVSQIIGETAARYGFDGILAPSAVESAGPHVRTIVILEGKMP